MMRIQFVLRRMFRGLLAALAPGFAPLAAALLLGTGASAQTYSPDILEVSERGPLAFEGLSAIDLSKGGAIEFWVAANWQGDPGFDPPVLINIGPEGILYQISVLRDRDGLVFANAGDEDVFLADLSDGRMHHVAINFMEDGLEAYVDGALVGSSDLLPLALPSAGLFVGGMDSSEAARLDGAIAQLRIWGEPLSEDEITSYRMRAVLDSARGDHPAAQYLLAQSDFANGELLLVDSMEELP